MKINRSSPDNSSAADVSRSNEANKTGQTQETRTAQQPASTETQQSTSGGVGSVKDSFEKAKPPSDLDKAASFAKGVAPSDLPRSGEVKHIVNPQDLPRSGEVNHIVEPQDLPRSPEAQLPGGKVRESALGKLNSLPGLPSSSEITHKGIIQNFAPGANPAGGVKLTADQFSFNQEGHLVITNKKFIQQLQSQMAEQLKPSPEKNIWMNAAKSPEEILFPLKPSALSVNQEGHLVIGDKDASAKLKSGLDQGRPLEEMFMFDVFNRQK